MLLALTSSGVTDRATSFQSVLRAATGDNVPVTRRSLGPHKSIISIEGTAEQTGDFVRTQTDRGALEWALLLWPGSALSLFLAFDEEWVSVGTPDRDWKHVLLSDNTNAPRGRANRDQYVFGGLRIRFYLQRTNPVGSVRQWLRCEWEPYRCLVPDENAEISRDDVLSALEFDAMEAAHPHFHFDSIPLTASTHAQMFSDSADTVQDFGSGATFGTFCSDGFVTSNETDLQHIHLPSSPGWPMTPFSASAKPSVTSPLPHQMYPASTDELDNWFAWNVRYFLNQFQVAMGD